jgi:ribosomal protein S18 acetylase RimI-like enzyme
MCRSTVTLRAAKPIYKEGMVCARYLDEVAEGFFRFLLGRRFEAILGRAYLQPGHSYSFENVAFAERDGLIVGMSLGFTAARHREFSDRPLREAAGLTAWRMRAVMALCAPLMRMLNTLAEGDFYLLSVGIDEEHRGEGIGSLLVDSIEEQAHEAGSTRLSLDVAAKNVGARRLYERRGMIVESQWPKRLPLPGIKLLRMTKAL